ncbi:MAG: hypothetical protein H0V81_12145 [Solirubrobacterales bacterium]|nr:hypothetical protein [Solirubrobacterales bacterium]
MAWKLTVRRGPKVAKSTHAELRDALDALAGALDATSTTATVQLFRRTYTPAQQVEVRGELRGPGRAHGGIDLHGDGTLTPWTGRLARRPLDVEPGESAYDALARRLG